MIGNWKRDRLREKRKANEQARKLATEERQRRRQAELETAPIRAALLRARLRQVRPDFDRMSPSAQADLLAGTYLELDGIIYGADGHRVIKGWHWNDNMQWWEQWD